mgnify:CR=1 FL=1
MNNNYKRTIKQGQVVVVAGFIGSLLWATLAPIDSGVPAQAVVSVESKRKIINHPTGGVISQMLIKEGQFVAKGQDLVILDKVQASTSQAAALKKWFVAKATNERLMAERQLQSTKFSQELIELSEKSEELHDILRDQAQLGESNVSSAITQIKTLKQAIDGLQSQASSLRDLTGSRRTQTEIIQKQIRSYENLNEKGYVSKNFVMDLSKQLADSQSQLQEAQANHSSILAKIAELTNRKQQLQSDLYANVDKQLAQSKAEEGQYKELLTSQNDALEKMAIKAPVDGMVVNLSTQSIGATIKPAESIMEIVPTEDNLIVEAKIPPQFIDKVHDGMKAKIRFDAYSRRLSNPTIEGEVQTVSADAINDSRSGQTFYTARIKAPSIDSLNKQGFQPTPGMPVSVVVTTGESSLLSYIITPLINRAKNSIVD